MFRRKKEQNAQPQERKAEAPKVMAEEPARREVTILTEKQILEKIEQLQPGSTVFFYLSGSPASGGPLGRGAAVIELNPNYPGKKQKKYILYVAEVEGMQPVGKGQKLLDSDKAQDVARWVKERHLRSG